MKYGDEEAHLLLLAVKPSHRRCGVASEMLAWLERSAEVAGVGRITLEARASNDAARAFYRHHGYAQAQLLPGYYGGRETSVRMVKDFGLSRTRSAVTRRVGLAQLSLRLCVAGAALRAGRGDRRRSRCRSATKRIAAERRRVRRVAARAGVRALGRSARRARLRSRSFTPARCSTPARPTPIAAATKSRRAGPRSSRAGRSPCAGARASSRSAASRRSRSRAGPTSCSACRRARRSTASACTRRVWVRDGRDGVWRVLFDGSATTGQPMDDRAAAERWVEEQAMSDCALVAGSAGGAGLRR